MKNDAKAESTNQKPSVASVSNIDPKKKDRVGLSFREYKELSAKDDSHLTETQRKQLADANEQLSKMAENIVSQYDFSAMADVIKGAYTISPAIQTLSRIDTSPMLKIVADMQSTSFALQSAASSALSTQAAIAPAIEAIYKSNLFTQNQFAALAAIQKSLTAFPAENILSSLKSIQDAFQAPFIVRTMFADFHTVREHILRNLRFDVSSLTASMEFSQFETVSVVVDRVEVEEDNLVTTTTATQSSNAGNLSFTDSASLQLEFNNLKQELRDLRQQLLAKDGQQNKLLVAPSAVRFQRTSSCIQIGQFKVAVVVSSKQTQFARVLLSTPDSITKRWDIEDVILEAFGERIDEDERDWVSKIRSYIHQLNNKILRDTNNTMPNFFVLDGVEVYVNPEYLDL